MLQTGKNIRIAGQAMQDELIKIINSGILSTEVKDNVLDTVRLKKFFETSKNFSKSLMQYR